MELEERGLDAACSKVVVDGQHAATTGIQAAQEAAPRAGVAPSAVCYCITRDVPLRGWVGGAGDLCIACRFTWPSWLLS